MFDCDFFKKECGILFVAGLVVGTIGGTFAKTEKGRALAVKSLVKGMICKDTVMEYATNLREDAEDICKEARDMAKAESDVVEVVCDCAAAE